MHIFLRVLNMGKKLPIHLLHKIAGSPKKMCLLQKSTSCQLQRIYNTTIYKQLSRKHYNNSNQKVQQSSPFSSTINLEHRHQRPASENPTKPRAYTNVTEGHRPLKPNFTNNNEISFLKLLDESANIPLHH